MARSGPDAPGRPSRLLVVLPSWIGDTVMATPALRALRGRWPEARFIGLGRAGLDELLAGTGLLDEFAADRRRGFLGPFAAAGAVRGPRPDIALLLPNSFRSGLVAWLARAPRRVGYARDGRRWLLTDPVAPPPRGRPAPIVDTYAELVETAFGVAVADRRPKLAPTGAQRAAAEALLVGVQRPFVLLNPGANRPDKRWPAERFAAVGAGLRRTGFDVAVTGGAAEAALAAQVAAGSGGTDLVARGVTLGALVGVLAAAALLVTNDTGPRHVAIGVGTPVVSLFGPTDHRWTLVPGAAERQVLAAPFLPEELMADRHPQLCAIDRITVGDVVAVAQGMLCADR